MFELGEETLRRHAHAYRRVPGALRRLEQGGEYQYRTQEEVHSWSPEAIATLQKAVREDDREAFREWVRQHP